MKIHVFENNNDLSKELVKRVLQSKNVIIPSGATPRRMYQELINIDLEGINFYQLDEWVGVGPQVVGSCSQMIQNDFVSKGKNVSFSSIDGTDTNAKRNMIDIISSTSIDLSILGVGLNGHIGLNEPGCDYDEYVVEMSLSSKSIEVANKKYFKQNIDITQGITYGIKGLLKSECVIIVLNSIEKKQILKQIISSQDKSIPAIYLKNKDNVEYFVTSDLLS